LEKLISLLIERQNIDQLEFTSITSERLPVLPGGIAILIEVMGQLGVEKLEVAQGALREGILFDLVGRSSEEDSRTRTIRAIAQRYHVDSDQADRVELTALALLDQVDVGWRLDEPSLRQLLAWAARVHEIGLDIAHAHYHRHGAYLLKHSDLPGFTRNEQSILAALVGAHRRKLVLKDIAAELPKFWVERVTRLALLLRLAVLFNRSRTYELPEMLKIEANRKIIKLHLASEWLQANPLTLADLEMEQAYVRAAGFQLILLTD
jgi:exopolyphosphatase/guanosine-5'-triphosphate,3'-diphosphate pyrophosphatase